MYKSLSEYYHYLCRMKPIRILQLFVMIAAVWVQGAASEAPRCPERLRTAIAALDSAVASRDSFRKIRKHSVDSLRARYNASPTFAACRDLSNALAAFNADTALYYLQQAYDMAERDHDSGSQESLMLDYAWMLHRGMLFSDALAVLDSVDTSRFERRDLITYYSILGRTYLRMSQQHILHSMRDAYRRQATDAFDSLAVFFPAGSVPRRITEAQICYIKGDSTLGAGELNEVMELITPGYEAYAVVAGMLAAYYKNKASSRDEYLYYLALSAASDVRSAGGEPLSLVALASELFRDGDVDRAYSYLNAAAEALDPSRPTLLSADIITPLDAVNRHILDRESGMRGKYLIFVIASCLVLLFSILLFLLCRRRIAARDRKLRLMADTVADREAYISRLLEICSVYLESMEDFNRLVGRKLKAGQAKDLYGDVESGKWLRECSDRFFEAFDAAVLKIYPDFVDRLNSLLLPDRHLVQPSPDRLSPEQRIIAFMRLGVTDSTRISKFLGLSLTTVYTYRNRVKSRAVDKDNFERNIRDIGKIA